MSAAGYAVPAAQQMRFARKTPSKQAGLMPAKVVLKPTLLKDHNLARVKPGWTPSYLVAFRMIILLRFFAAMYSSISDCDEGAVPARRARRPRPDPPPDRKSVV